MPPLKGLARTAVDAPVRGLFWALLFAVVGLVPPFVLVSPLFAIVSGGLLALIALRRGGRVAGATVGGGLLLLAAAGGASGSGVVIGLLYGGIIWSAPVVAALLLRRTAQLSQGVLLLLAMAAVGLVLGYALLGDLGALWLTRMEPLVAGLIKLEPINQTQIVEAMGRMAPVIPGLMAAGAAGVWIIALSLARSWQAEQVNPGGFGLEFRQLQVPKGLLFVMVLGVVPMAASGTIVAQLAGNLALLGALGFGLQGLAVVHQTTTGMKNSRFWLGALYVLLGLATLQTLMLLAMVGVIDCWANFRKLNQTSVP